MSANIIDQNIVEMKFDNKQFESNVGTSLSTIDKLKKSLNFDGAERAFDNISSAAKNCNMSGLVGAVESVGLKFSAMQVMAATALSNITNSAVNAGKRIVSALTIDPIKSGFQEYETQINAVQTILANTQNVQKSASKEAIDSINATADAAVLESIRVSESSLDNLKKTQSKQLDEFNKLSSDKIDILKDEHEETLDIVKDYYDEEIDLLEEKYEQESDALSKAIEEETSALKEAHREKLALYQEEYMEKLRVIDEERYNRLKAVDDQIDSINALTKAEEEQLQIQKQNKRLAELRDDVLKADDPEKRRKAQERLSEYENEIARKQLLKQREALIENLKLSKEAIAEQYDELELQIQDEYYTKVENENALYDLQSKNLKEEQAAKKKALKEDYEDTKEFLQNSKEEELKQLKKIQETELKNLKEQQDAEKAALKERFSSELDALESYNKQALANIETRKNEELKALNAVSMASGKGSTLSDVNKALDELNEYADKTIYNFTEMTRNIGTFTAAGIDLDTSVSAIKGIANLAAVSGSTSQQASTAMYQLSQALASGTVKLMDWNSVVNAGMGGQVFQNALKETARVHGIAIDEMIMSEGSFRETLQKGWLTSDILTETLSKFTGDLNEEQLKSMGYAEDQIKEIIKLGQTANDAATKVKTFTQLFDTLKEAAQSGWTQSWEIIVGDFEEAKSLLTEASNIFGGIIGDAAEKRNAALFGGLSSGWKQLLDQGIMDEESFTEEITKNAGDAFKDITKDSKNFEEALKKGIHRGIITSDTLAKSVKTLGDKIRGMSEEERKAAGYTSAHLKSIEKLEAGIEDGSISMENFISMISNLSGREKIIESFRNILRGVLLVIKPISEAFNEIFPPITAEKIYNITEKLRQLTEQFRNFVSETKFADNLKSTFKGLFSVLDIVGQAFGAVFDAVKPLFGEIGNLGEGVLETTARWGDWVTALSQTIRENDIFGKSIQKVIDFFKNFISKVKEVKDKIVTYLEPAIEAVKTFAASLAEKIKLPGLELLHTLLQRIQTRLSQVIELMSGFKSVVVASLKMVANTIKKTNMFSVLSAFLKGVRKISSGILSAIGSLTDGLIEKLSNADFEGAFDLINSFLGVGIGVGITKFLKSAVDVFKGFKDITEGITNVFDGVRGCLEAYQTKLKAGTLMTIALAIGVLAASLVAVSLIDSEKLTGAIAAITTLFAALVSSMAILESVSKSKGKVAGVSALLITMSIAVLALTLSLKSISELNPDELAVGITGVMSLVASLVAATKIFQNGSAGAVKGMAQMILLAAAVKILASACEDLSALKWNELAKGLAGVGVLMAELVFFLNTAKFSGKTITTATGIVILAAAIKILASACRDFAQMDVEQLTKGLISVGVLLAEISAFTNLTGNAKHVMSTGVSLIAIAAAMKILASAINDLSGLSWEQLAIGLTGMAGSLVAITAAVNLMPKNLTGIGVGLIAVSTAIVILSSALGKMGGMEWEGIAKGLAALGGAIGILAAGLNLMNGTLAGSAAMVIATSAILALVPALSILGAMSWEGIVKGLVALAGTFAVIGVAALVLTPIVPVIIALSASLAVLGGSILAIGIGLQTAGIGLSAFAVGITALATAASLGTQAASIAATITVIVTAILSFIPLLIKKFGEGLIEICKVIAAGAPAIKDAIKAVVLSSIEVITECIPAIVKGALSLIVSILESLVEYTPRIVDSLMKFIIELINGIARNLPELIGSIVNLLMSLFDGVIAALKNVDMEVLIKGIAGIGFLSSIMLALSAMALLVPGAIIGVAGMGLVIAELALVLAAIGKMAKIPGLTEMVSGSTNLLTVIGTAIGGFVGGITGGFMSGVSSQFPKIASDLSDFMTNIKPFVDGASSIGGSMLTGVLSLTAAITALTAASLINGLTSWITGGVSMLTFGQELAGFGPYFKRYYESIKGINGSVVESSANAAKALAEMATNLPNSGGVAAWFAGENSLSKFADELVIFGPKLKRYADSVKGLDSAVVVNSANAAKALAEMAKNLPNSGGVAGWFAGENNLSDFADELVAFGPKLKLYASSVKGLDPEVISNSTEAAKAISEMAKNLPNQGGVVNWFTGDNTLSMFGHELAIFAPFLKSYANNVKGIDTEVVECSVNAAKTISEMAKNLPNKGGIVSWFAGDNDIGSFGESLETFGKGFAAYYKHIKDVNPNVVLSTKSAASALAEIQKSLPKKGGLFSDVSTLKDFGKEIESFGSSLKDYYKSVKNVDTVVLASVIAEVNKLIEMALSMADINTGSMSDFGRSLFELGCTGVSKFIEAFEGAKKKIESVARNMLSTFSSAAEAKAKDLKKTFDGIVDGLISVFISPKNLLDINKSAADLMTNFEKGIKSGEAKVNSAIVSILTASVNNIKKKRTDFYSAATHLLNAIVESVKNQTAAVVSYFTKLAGDAVNGIRGKRNDFYKAAEYVVGGFATGVSDNLEKTSSSADNLADTFLKSFEKKLDINSPSKETERIGQNTGLGFINAINGFLDKAYDAGYNMADKALNGISKAISKVNEFVDGNVEVEPTIRPVLDLSEIQNGVGRINGLMGGVGGYSLTGSVDMANSIGASMGSRIINTFTEGNSEKSPGGEKSENSMNNTFYITGNDPKEIANQVSRIIQRQVERRESAWA